MTLDVLHRALRRGIQIIRVLVYGLEHLDSVLTKIFFIDLLLETFLKKILHLVSAPNKAFQYLFYMRFADCLKHYNKLL